MAEGENKDSAAKSIGGQIGRIAGRAAASRAAGALGAAAAGGSLGATAGSIVPGIGTAVGALLGSIAGPLVFKAIKYLGIAGIGLLVVVIFMFFLVPAAIMVIFFGGGGGGGPDQAEASELCSSIPSTFNSSNVIQKVNDNIGTYRSAARAGDIPWEMLAAVHYRETNNDATAENMYQFDPPPPQVNVDDFVAASRLAAQVLQEKAAAGSVGRALRSNMNPENPRDQESIKDAFWGYNGRADAHRDHAESLDFDPDKEGFEGSFYVMNNWDSQRVGMLMLGTVFADQEDSRDGAWKVFILLRNADYGADGKITAINEVCPDTGPTDGSVPHGCPMRNGSTGLPGQLFGAPRDYGPHVGIDMEEYDGAEVLSTMNGVVELAEYLGGAGNTVRIGNGRYKTRYLHMYGDLRVDVGDQVRRGTVLGRQDSSGGNYGSHLHYEVWQEGAIVDPTPFIPMENRVGATCRFR